VRVVGIAALEQRKPVEDRRGRNAVEAGKHPPITLRTPTSKSGASIAVSKLRTVNSVLSIDVSIQMSLSWGGFHRSSSAPLAWSPDRRNLESVLRDGKLPGETILGAQGAPGPIVTRADAHQSHTDLYALDAKTLYTNTLARFIYRGSETPVGDCY
jgi:hypothetical protein